MKTSTTYKALSNKTLEGIIKGFNIYTELREALQKIIDEKLEKHTGLNFNTSLTHINFSMTKASSLNILELSDRVKWDGKLINHDFTTTLFVGVYYSKFASHRLFNIDVRIKADNEKLYFDFDLVDTINSNTFSNSNIRTFVVIRIPITSFSISIS